MQRDIREGDFVNISANDIHHQFEIFGIDKDKNHIYAHGPYGEKVTIASSDEGWTVSDTVAEVQVTFSPKPILGDSYPHIARRSHLIAGFILGDDHDQWMPASIDDLKVISRLDYVPETRGIIYDTSGKTYVMARKIFDEGASHYYRQEVLVPSPGETPVYGPVQHVRIIKLYKRGGVISTTHPFFQMK